MKTHMWQLGLVLIIVMSNYALLNRAQSYVLAESFDHIKSKFEPWLWEELQQLEANGTVRPMSIVVGIDCESWNRTDAYNFKEQIATLLASEHNATITWVGRVLSFINIQVMSTEVKKIAAYSFVDGLGDGEREEQLCLDTSTTAIRSSLTSPGKRHRF